MMAGSCVGGSGGGTGVAGGGGYKAGVEMALRLEEGACGLSIGCLP